MPPKTDSKAMLQSPKCTNDSYAAAASGNVSRRTRGAHGRRPSNESLEAIASQADLAQYDLDQGSGSSASTVRVPVVPLTTISQSSATSTPSLTAEQQQMLFSMIQSFQSSNATSGSTTSSGRPTKTAASTISVSSKPSVSSPAVSTLTSGGSDSKSITIEPSVGRLLSGVSAHTSIPIFATSGSGVSTIPPGGVLGDTDYRDTGNDSDSDDDDQR